MSSARTTVRKSPEREIVLPLSEDAGEPNSSQKQRRRALVIPREHGAWGMLLIPMVVGGVVGVASGGRVAPVLTLAVAIVALFWLRAPLENWMDNAATGALNQRERRIVLSAIVPLLSIALIALTGLFWEGMNRDLIWLGIAAAATFGAQVVLKRGGRSTRVAAELVGAIALTVTAAASYCAATGRMDARGLGLWLASWLFAANQIHFVWLRIRGMRARGVGQKFRLGWSFLVGNLLSLGAMLLAYRLGWIPGLAWIAIGPLWVRGIAWFFKKSQPLVIRRLGWSELAHALFFGVLVTSSFLVS
jgi:hypothetical protein